MAGDDDAYASLYEEYVQDLYQYGLFVSIMDWMIQQAPI